jgi:hypothetical protein
VVFITNCAKPSAKLIQISPYNSAGCFTHLLADGRLRDQVATCPNCRVEISKNNASRNLAVEKAVSELPSECQVIDQIQPSILNRQRCGKLISTRYVSVHQFRELFSSFCRQIKCFSFRFYQQFCNQEFPRSSLDYHERNECDERPTECKYSIIGCQWNGPMHEAKEHESSCAHPKSKLINCTTVKDLPYAIYFSFRVWS